MALKKAPTTKKKAVGETAVDEKEKPKKKSAAAPRVKKEKKETDATKLKKKAVRTSDESVEPDSFSPRASYIPPPAPVAPSLPVPEVKKVVVAPKPAPVVASVPVPVAPPAPTPVQKEKPKIVPLPVQYVARPTVKPVEKPVVKVARPETPAVQVAERGTPKAAEPVASLSTKKKLQFNEMMTVKDLAAAMDMKVTEVIKKLLTLGTPASINQRLQLESATLVADSFGFDLVLKSIYVDERKDDVDDEKELTSRPPVVTVMGHVDHGKTSLLDAIRSTRVADKEAGGITQHIGAYQVKADKGLITFLDTPGHEAFTAMRARGAMATDIVILVVAADDSVMPQTIEAIDHAKAANVPIVVAINKVDLPQANVQKVKQELAQHNLVAEDWGGKTVMVEVSAKTRKNIDKLIEMILLEAELLELKANPNRSAKGVVLEARVDPRRGITATILIQAGTLRVGDVVVCGLSHGRIRAMVNDKGESLETVGPATPAAVLGLAQVPQVGDQLSVVGTDREAREIAERRQQSVKDSTNAQGGHISLESLHSKIAEGKIQDLPIILKADVQGSLQALQDSLGRVSGALIQLRFVHAGIGNVNESDVLLAEASDAIVFGFNVKVEGSAEAEAKQAGVDIRTYKIIYEMLADIRAAMEGLLKPEEREAVKGRAQVKTAFNSSKYGMVAGCMVLEGTLHRGSKARVVRDGQVIGTGSIGSLRRFKEDVKDVEKGYECGLSIDGMKAYTAGDLIEAYVIEKHARRLEG